VVDFAGDHVPVCRAIVDRTMVEEHPVVVTDRFVGHNAGDSVERRLGCVLCAPVVIDEQPVVYLWFGRKELGHPFTVDERRVAEFVASVAAAVMARVRLQSELLARVIEMQEQDRARVARDLHDEVGQALTSVLLGLRLVGAVAGETDGNTDISARLAELSNIVTAALAEVRRLAFDLRPTVLDDFGLVRALRRLTDDIGRRHSLAVQLTVAGVPELERLMITKGAETAAYRFVQEALTNVIRHAGARRAEISITRDPAKLRITVADDGSGFDPEVNRQPSFGLRAMVERAALVDGTVTLVSAPGKGTSVTMEVPVG
jgi:signal transduction histidine kinase